MGNKLALDFCELFTSNQIARVALDAKAKQQKGCC